MSLSRKVGYLEKFQDLKPGDILLFRPSKTPFDSQNTIMFFQKLLSSQHGHYDTIHAAICVAFENKQAVIAHSYETTLDKKVWRGYIRQPLEEMLASEDKLIEGNGDRSFLVFRPRSREIAEDIAKIAGDEKANSHILWTYTKAIKSYFYSAFWEVNETCKPKKKALDGEAICSQFVTNVVKLAAQAREEKGVNHVLPRSSLTPKALESFLYHNHQAYDLLCYPGKDAYWTLLNAIRKELHRIKKQGSENFSSKQKYSEAIVLYHRIRWQHKYDSVLNRLDKCIELLRVMMPVLNQHTGFRCFGLWNTTSYIAVRDKARKMGIFERDYLPCQPKK